MRHLLMTGLMLLAGFSALAHADETPASAQCIPDQERVRASLDHIYREYLALGKSASVAQLVTLDTRLRKLLSVRTMCVASDEEGWERSSDAAIGVSIEHYSGMFQYSGDLLLAAHRLNPNTPLRSSTLYAMVEPHAGDPDAWTGVPNFSAARAYLKEFPSGPFAADAALGLATGYAQAYSALRWKGALGDVDELACVADKLGPLAGSSEKQRVAYAKTTAEHYFRLSFRLRKPNDGILNYYKEWRRSDQPLYFYCPD